MKIYTKTGDKGETSLYGGTRVSKATLHNFDLIKEKDIREGDFVVIRKAGEIIPEVVKPLLERRGENIFVTRMIGNCPICGSELAKKENEVAHFCLNKKCPARKIENLIHFASKKAMNIEGLGEQLIEDFYNLGYLKKNSDFYKLENYYDEIKELEGFQEKKLNNLIDGVNVSKNRSLEKLIFALGIRHVGEKVALIIAKRFNDLDKVIDTAYDDFVVIDEIGPEIANSIIRYFSEEDNLIEVEELRKFVNFKYIGSKVVETFFTNKKVVITGTFDGYKRDEINGFSSSLTERLEPSSFFADSIITPVYCSAESSVFVNNSVAKLVISKRAEFVSRSFDLSIPAKKSEIATGNAWYNAKKASS